MSNLESSGTTPSKHPSDPIMVPQTNSSTSSSSTGSHVQLNDIRSEYDPLHTDTVVVDEEERKLFAADLGVEQIAVDAETSREPLPEQSQNQPGRFLPDILGEDRFAVLREEMVAKIRKMDGLIQNAEDIRRRYEHISDAEGEKTVNEMLEKLIMQRQSLTAQLAEVSPRAHEQKQPESSTSLDSDLLFIENQEAFAKKGNDVPKLAVPQKMPESSANKGIDMKHAIDVLRNNIADVRRHKFELEVIIEQIKVRRQNCETDEDRIRFTHIMDKHEARIAQLDRTLMEAERTVSEMENLERQANAVRKPQENVVVTETESDDDDDTPMDPSTLHALRDRLSSLRYKVWAGESQQEPAKNDGFVKPQDTSNNSKNPLPSKTNMERPASARESAAEYRDAPQMSRDSDNLSDFVRLAARHSRQPDPRPDVFEVPPPPPPRGNLFTYATPRLSLPPRLQPFYPSMDPRQEILRSELERQDHSFSPFHLDQRMDPRLLNNAVPYDHRERMSMFEERDLRQSPRSRFMQPRLAVRQDGYRDNELYGLSSKSGDDYYIIDNIHNHPREAVPRNPPQFDYRQLSEMPSSESENDNIYSSMPIRNPTREDPSKLDNNFRHEKRNDLSVSNKNSNSTNRKKDRQPHYQFSRTLDNRDRGYREFTSAMDDKEVLHNQIGSLFGRDMPVPEVVASLQIIMAEQQKILNSCAQFVSKPSVNYDSSASHRSNQSREEQKYERSHREIPMINNSLRDLESSRVKDQRDQETHMSMLNNQRVDSGRWYNSGSSPRPGRDEPSPDDLTGLQRYVIPLEQRRLFVEQQHLTKPKTEQEPTRISGIGPVVELMNRVMREYENDLGALCFMLDSIASVRSSISRVKVAGQLALIVAAERDKTEISKQEESVQSPFPLTSELPVDASFVHTIPLMRKIPGRMRAESFPEGRPRQQAPLDRFSDAGFFMGPDAIGTERRLGSVSSIGGNVAETVARNLPFESKPRARSTIKLPPLPSLPVRHMSHPVLRLPAIFPQASVLGGIVGGNRNSQNIMSEHFESQDGTPMEPGSHRNAPEIADLFGQVRNMVEETRHQDNNSGSNSGSNGDFDIVADFAKQSGEENNL